MSAHFLVVVVVVVEQLGVVRVVVEQLGVVRVVVVIGERVGVEVGVLYPSLLLKLSSVSSGW